MYSLKLCIYELCYLIALVLKMQSVLFTQRYSIGI